MEENHTPARFYATRNISMQQRIHEDSHQFKQSRRLDSLKQK